MTFRMGFGGGCHWCTEAVFQSLADVDSVHQGFIRSAAPHDTYSEAVEVVFDPARITIDALVRVHLATHASTAAHKMRGKYRSAIYVHDDTRAAAMNALALASQDTGLSFVTQILNHNGFKASDARFHNYRQSEPDRPFCKTYIDPKLAKLRRDFGHLMRAADPVN